ncbi:macrolide family glycosyltransferase [Priestia endophytica]|uniref:macrolide family glycosyltransferase n=1 Tax=Priestia endophytica TaxID=135735 RepID=UPI000DCA8E0D|nr:macrolide family glycosyltransferase [Priestia endophytica]RAS78892.1 glycosyl transferase [Priestia endophytica]
MSSVLFINLPAEGHVNPTVGLVKELVDRGETITYYCAERFRERLENVGAVVRTYEDFLETMNANALPTMSKILEVNSFLLDKIVADIQGETYDYIIYDEVCLAAVILAKMLNIPKICNCTTFAFTQKMLEDMKKQLNVTEGIEGFDEESEKILTDIEQKHNVDLTFIRHKGSIMPNPGDLTIVYTSEHYQMHREELDDTFKFVGPSIVKRQHNIEFPLEKLENDSVIFISLGTIFNENIEFYQTCFKAFADFEGTVVMSIGRKLKIDELGDIPTNFIVKNYVPQLEVLQHTDVFFTHGGMNSSSEGFYFNIPLAVLPVSVDQPIVAKRIAELGAGIHLDLNSITAEKLKETAHTLLCESSYKENATKISTSFKNAGGYKKAVDEIFSFKHQALSESVK